jgi:hypothetical protein
LAINRDDPLEEAGEFVGQRAGVGALDVEAIGQGEINLENVKLKHVARHRPVDVDRPGQNVWTGAAIGDFAADGPDIFRHGARRNHAGSVNIGRIGPAYAFDGDDVARIDSQCRLERSAEISDVDRLWARHQGVLGGGGRFAQRKRRQK